MGEAFNRAGQVYPANQPGVGSQYDMKPVLAPTGATGHIGHTGVTGAAPAVVAVAPVRDGPVHYADGAPRPGVTGATGESFLQHLEDEIKAHI